MYELEQVAEACKLLGDKTRLTVLAALQEKELCVCDLVELLQTSQPNVSQHMRKLRDAKLVKETKKGQWVYYSLNLDDKPYVREVLGFLPSMKEKISQLKSDCC